MDTSLLISVIGLMATFAQERRGRSDSETQATIEDYKEWLRRGRHDIVIGMLDSNQELLIATEQFLRSGQEEILERLDLLEESLTQSLICAPGWAELIQSLTPPKTKLSEQAIAILRWLDATGGSQAIMFKQGRDSFLSPQDGSGGQFHPTEPRFFEADLESLVNHDLLIPSFASKGSPVFTITRPAVDLVQSLDHNEENNG